METHWAMSESERPGIPSGLSDAETSRIMDELLEKYPPPDEDFNVTFINEEDEDVLEEGDGKTEKEEAGQLERDKYLRQQPKIKVL